jgi:hypothetical protein
MRVGALVGLAFGLLWWLVGAGAIERPLGTALQVAGLAIFAGAAAWIVRRAPSAGRRRPRWSYYIIAVVAEVAVIALAQAWLGARGLNALLFPVVGVIVGLHFIGLWLAFARRRFLALAATMVAINLLALLLPLGGDTRLALSGFGSAAALLATAVLP